MSCFLFCSQAAFAQDLHDCLIEPSTTVKLASPVQGVLKAVFVDRGSVIKAGDVIAELNSDLEGDALAIAQARANNGGVIEGRKQQIDLLQRKYERASMLVSNRISSSAQAEEVEADLRAAIANLADAEFDRDLNRLEAQRSQRLVVQRTIRSPIDGVVTARSLSAGEYVSEQSNIVEIARMDELNVEVFLPARDYKSVFIGMKATIVPAEPIGGEYPATVSIIDQVFDQRSNTFGIRLKLENKNGALPAGLRCTAVFRAAAAPVDSAAPSPK